MPKCPIVSPDQIRLSLPDGEFIVVRRELNAGEYRDMITSQFKNLGDSPEFDRDMFGVSVVMAYLLGWSYVDADMTTPLPVSKDAYLSFDQQTYRDIREAIEAHHAAFEKSVEQRKNDQAGERASSKTLTSVA